MKYSDKNTFDKANMFGLGSANTDYAKYFIGESFLNPLTDPQKGLFAANVTFEPGCRNNWHIHHASRGGGQLLICTAGEGWYCEEGKEAISLHEGSVVMIPAEVNIGTERKKTAGSAILRLKSRERTARPNGVSRYPTKNTINCKGEKNMAVKQTAGRDALGDFAPKFAELNDDVLFGEVWSREDKLSLRDRSVVTVVALMAQGLIDESFRYHLINAKNNGITKEEIAEIVTHAAFYCGWPKAWAVFRMAKEIWD